MKLAMNLDQTLAIDMGIPLRGGEIDVAKKFLHRA